MSRHLWTMPWKTTLKVEEIQSYQHYILKRLWCESFVGILTLVEKKI